VVRTCWRIYEDDTEYTYACPVWEMGIHGSTSITLQILFSEIH